MARNLTGSETDINQGAHCVWNSFAQKAQQYPVGIQKNGWFYRIA